jgi:iron complex outermembrane receptor protein
MNPLPHLFAQRDISPMRPSGNDSDVPHELKLFQEMPLVITEARKPQRITEAPSTIDVITDEDIRRSGALTLAELLERLPGIYTPRAHNGLGMLWIRGVGGRFNDNALLLVDGVPCRTLYYFNFPLNEKIPLEGGTQRAESVQQPG